VAYKAAVLKAPEALNFQWTKTYKMDDNDGETALHFAAKNGFGQSGDYVPADGDMPLHTAASAGRADVVEFLIEKGADVNVIRMSSRFCWHAVRPLIALKAVARLFGTPLAETRSRP